MRDPRPLLTDRAALERNRHRALAAPEPALFLHETAAVELEERLAMVNRRFTAPALVAGIPAPWQVVLPGATVVPDSDLLNLQPGAHDLVVHALGLHWAEDPVGQLIQARRALAPDGLFLGFTFGGQTVADLRAVFAASDMHARHAWQLAANSIDASFAPPADKAAWRAQLDECFAKAAADSAA